MPVHTYPLLPFRKDCFMFCRINKLLFFLTVAFVSLLTAPAVISIAEEPSHILLPETWRADWLDPPAKDKPLQIIHGHFGHGKEAIEKRLDQLVQLGLGGIVTNVPTAGYLESEEGWSDLVETVRCAKEKGLRVWIYDEDGYPSLAAGGLVLKKRPDLEAKELVYDPARPDPFEVRPCFEYTHASNNYCSVRRYPSLVNPEASKLFLEVTHESYKKRLGPELFAYVEAFFTDEPSTNALNTGLLPEKVRNRVRIDNPVDLSKPNLPMVVWEDDFPTLYKQMYGEDLLAVRKSLFTGNTEADKKIRRQFWQMVALRTKQGFYEPLHKWAAAQGKASSGHTLWEESLFHHVPFDGDKLEVLKEFDIPGLDFLTSCPSAAGSWGWRATILPSSAAILTGNRKIFTENSDHDLKMAEKPCASVEWMSATAAWQATFGVTEFTLYYNTNERTPEQYNRFCDCVGRINAIVRDAQFTRDVAMFYPIRTIQEEYLPVANQPERKDMSEKVRALSQSWESLGCKLIASQTPFYAMGESDMQKTLLDSGDSLCAPKTLIIPKNAELSNDAQKIVEQFEKKGGKVQSDEWTPAKSVLDPLGPAIVRGTFLREGKTIQILVNTGDSAWQGRLKTVQVGDCLVCDPMNGSVEKKTADSDGIALNVTPLQTLIIIQ